MLDFRQKNAILFEYHLSKHKLTTRFKNLGGAGSLAPLATPM